MGRPAPDGRGSFSGINPQNLWDMIRSISSRTGYGNDASAQPAIGNWMSQAHRIGLDTGALTSITRHLSWAQDQLPMLRQRHFLAVQADKPYPGHRGMTTIADIMVDISTPAEAARDAAEAAKLARTDPSQLTNDDIQQLDGLLTAHENNPFFAEKFAADLGTKATLGFYAALADPRQFRVNPRSRTELSPELAERQVLLGDLETSLGATLATASRIDDPAMRQWQHDMIALGGQDLGDGGQYHVYGFQVMSDLMRHGVYDTSFLGQYGTALVAFETKHTSDLMGGLQRRVYQKDTLPWNVPAFIGVQLHYGAAGNDGGCDPMTGFMEALGHNPAASTAFFKNPKNFDYLTEKRTWPPDFTATDAKTIAGYKSLGHALESATMGTPYDADPPGLHRTKDTAAVMVEVVNRYGQPAAGSDTKKTGFSGADLLSRQDGIGPSLGRMTAAYIDDVDWGLDKHYPFSVFNNERAGRAQVDRARFRGADLQRFLGTLGHDDDAYKMVTNAQQAYTTSVVQANQPKLSPDGQVLSAGAETSIRVGAQLQAIMDRSWVEEFMAKGEAADQKFNESMDKRAERQTMIAGAVTAGLFAFAPEVSTGIGATVVPLATEQVHGEMDSRIEQNISGYADSQHRHLADVRQGRSSKVYEAGREASMIPADQLLSGRQFDSWTPEERRRLSESLQAAQETGYSSGSLTQEQSGNLPVVDNDN